MEDHHIHCPRPRRPPFLRSVPSFEEAESATFDVSAALEKLFHPPPEDFNAALEKLFLPSEKTASTDGGASSPTTTVQESGLPPPLEACIDDTERPVTVSSSEPNPANWQAFGDQESDIPPPLEDFVDDDTERPVTVSSSSKPNPALQAFSLLRNNPAVQNVVASLVSDKNLWEAVMNNKTMMEYMVSSESEQSLDISTNVTAGEIIPTDDSSASGPIRLTQAMKLRVLAIVRSLSEFYQKIFGNPAAAAEEGSSSSAEAAEESSSDKSIWKCTCISAPFMVLTIAVIMVVMVKRE